MECPLVTAVMYNPLSSVRSDVATTLPGGEYGVSSGSLYFDDMIQEDLHYRPCYVLRVHILGVTTSRFYSVCNISNCNVECNVCVTQYWDEVNLTYNCFNNRNSPV